MAITKRKTSKVFVSTEDGRKYQAHVLCDRVSINRDGVWVGTGRIIKGRIECSAVLPEDIYEQIESYFCF